jgi:hypothetical protein
MYQIISSIEVHLGQIIPHVLIAPHIQMWLTIAGYIGLGFTYVSLCLAIRGKAIELPPFGWIMFSMISAALGYVLSTKFPSDKWLIIPILTYVTVGQGSVGVTAWQYKNKNELSLWHYGALVTCILSLAIFIWGSLSSEGYMQNIGTIGMFCAELSAVMPLFVNAWKHPESDSIVGWLIITLSIACIIIGNGIYITKHPTLVYGYYELGAASTMNIILIGRRLWLTFKGG